MDSPEIALLTAHVEDEPVLRRLVQLYQYDLAEGEGADPDEHGLFAYRWLDHYWTDPDRHPFLIRVDGRLAGFALVNGHALTDGVDYAMAEFFVTRRHRRQGIGEAAAREVFGQFDGVWEVRVSDWNTAAAAFWQRVITQHTGAPPEVHRRDGWDGPIFRFTSRDVRR